MIKPSLKTKSTSTNVTEEEYGKLERTAQAGGKTAERVAPGCHITQCRAGAESGPSDGSEAQVLMAELVVPRTVLPIAHLDRTCDDRTAPTFGEIPAGKYVCSVRRESAGSRRLVLSTAGRFLVYSSTIVRVGAGHGHLPCPSGDSQTRDV
jgi:hypothetical protein